MHAKTEMLTTELVISSGSKTSTDINIDTVGVDKLVIDNMIRFCPQDERFVYKFFM